MNWILINVNGKKVTLQDILFFLPSNTEEDKKNPAILWQNLSKAEHKTVLYIIFNSIHNYQIRKIKLTFSTHTKSWNFKKIYGKKATSIKIKKKKHPILKYCKTNHHIHRQGHLPNHHRHQPDCPRDHLHNCYLKKSYW